MVITGGQEVPVTDPEKVNQILQTSAQFGKVFHYYTDPNDDSEQPQVIPASGPEGADPNAVPGSEMVVFPATMEQMIRAGVLTVNEVPTDRILRVFTVGGQLLYKDVMPISDYPLIPLFNRHNRNPYPLSDVRFAKPIQEYINKIRSLIMAHAANSTNVKVFVPRGGVDKKELEEKWAQAGAGYFEYDPEIGIPIVAGPVPLPNELYKNEADALRDIERIFGIYQMQQGDTSQAPTTYKGTLALDEYGQRRMRSKKDDVEAFLNQVARVVVQLVQDTYTERKVIRLVQPNNAPKEVILNQPIYDEYTQDVVKKINDVTAGRYDVVVVSGSMMPSNRWAQAEYYMEMHQKGIIDQVEVLKKLEVVDVEGVLNRFSQIAKMQQQIEGLTAELKRVSGDLQTREREAYHANVRTEMEKVKSELRGVAGDAKRAGTLYDARLGDLLRDQREAVVAADESANTD